MKRGTTNKPSRVPDRVAVFSPGKKLIAVFSSKTLLAKFMDVSTPSVTYACNGTTVACKGFYLRSLDKTDIELPDDFGTLTLERFDELNGERRLTYPDRGMRKKRTAKTIQQ
jgi:hypothetical protein